MQEKTRGYSRRVFYRTLLAVMFSLALLSGLGGLRHRAGRLAYQLESINASIQRYVQEETMLRQELSALVAPIKIYSYCKERLGMQKVLKVETLPVRFRGDRMASVKGPAEKSTWRQSLAWLWGGRR